MCGAQGQQAFAASGPAQYRYRPLIPGSTTDGDPRYAQANSAFQSGCCCSAANAPKTPLITVVADCYLAEYYHAAWTMSSSKPWGSQDYQSQVSRMAADLDEHVDGSSAIAPRFDASLSLPAPLTH